MTFIAMHIILSFIYFYSDLFEIKKYIFHIMDKYLAYLLKNDNQKGFNNLKVSPPKRKKSFKLVKKRKSNKLNSKFISNYKNNSQSSQNNNMKSKISENYSQKCDTNKNNLLLTNNSFNISKNIKRKHSSEIKMKKKPYLKNKIKNENNGIHEINDIRKDTIDFIDYLEPSLDDLDFDDALKKDKRKFCIYFYELIKERQIIANTFFATDALKPKTVKIMLFDLNIILYFVINGLFYNEDYVSEVYHLEKEDSFFSFFPRSIERFIYTTIVSLVINIIVECFMVDESKIKGILIREKENETNLKYEMTLLIKKLYSSIILFILVSFFLYIVFFYYLLCFNYVYPHMQIEWIKSSITIVIIMQILSIISCFIQTLLRFLSFRCKSEKMYKISRLLAQ